MMAKKMSFLEFKDLAKYAKEYAEELSEAAVNVATEAFVITCNDTITETPVGNDTLWEQKAPLGYTGGAMRANWVISENFPDLTTDDSKRSVPTINAKDFKNVKLGATYYFTNSMPYAQRIEYGWSTQAPNGMVRKNAAKFDSTVNKIVRSVL